MKENEELQPRLVGQMLVQALKSKNHAFKT